MYYYYQFVMTDNLISQFQIKKLFKTLSKAKGNGTSMITLIISKGSQISQIANMLTNETALLVILEVMLINYQFKLPYDLHKKNLNNTIKFHQMD